MTNRGPTWITIKLYLLALVTGCFSCAPDEICFTDNGTQVGVSFQRIVYPGTDSAFLENDTLVFEEISALDTDSIFAVNDTLSTVALPLNTGRNSTTFVFETDTGTFSLNLQYRRTQRLISTECGPEQIIDQLEAGPSTFDSLAVVLPALTEPPQTNVEIYR